MDELDTERDRGAVANVIALAALLALGMGYLAMFDVLGEGAYASKFENGSLPTGFDPAGGHFAAGIMLAMGAAAVVGIVTAASIRTTKTVGVTMVVGFLGAIPFVPLALLTWGLAF